MRQLVFAAVAATILVQVGCVYPTSTTTQGGVASSFSFVGIPPDAIVTVDGAVVGKAGDYSGAKVLAVSPGTHKVTIQHSGRLLVDRDFYVGRDSTVNVR